MKETFWDKTTAVRESFCAIACMAPKLTRSAMAMARYVDTCNRGKRDYSSQAEEFARDLGYFHQDVCDVIALYNASLVYSVRGTGDLVGRLSKAHYTLWLDLLGLYLYLSHDQEADEAWKRINRYDEIVCLLGKITAEVTAIHGAALANDTLRDIHPIEEMTKTRLPLPVTEE